MSLLNLARWQTAVVGLVLAVAAVLLVIWWRQQSRRWMGVLAICLAAAPLLGYWASLAFHVADYRAGCDGLCPGYRGAPLPAFQGEAAGGGFLPLGFAVDTLAYLVLLLGWAAFVRAVLHRLRGDGTRRGWLARVGIGLALAVAPFALSPLYLPPPEAHVRGDSQRVAINAQREVYMYDQLASAPVVRVGLDDVRPRPDGEPGMTVCLRTYTYFYLPTGFMFMHMAPDGVHSQSGGVLPRTASCWD